MKLPNGYGTVRKLSGKRRRPFGVLVTTGWDDDGKQIREYIDYTKTRKEGYKILDDYHRNPFDLKYKDITFEEIWEELEKHLLSLVDKGKMSRDNYVGYVNAFYNHCKSLHKEKIMFLKYKKMQDVIDNAKSKQTGKSLGHTGKQYIKLVCKQTFDYAIKYYDLPIYKNPCDLLEVEPAIKSELHKPFTPDEKKILWKNTDNDIIKVTLIYCYSGLRPNELFKTHKSKIFLKENYFITGSKTKAGKERKIPIHPKIKPLIKYFYKNDCEYPFTTVLENFSYDKFKKHFRKLMKQLNFDHVPSDGRHTFITNMKEADADVFILKLIVGHSISDVTESAYTHRDINNLLKEVKKIT